MTDGEDGNAIGSVDVDVGADEAEGGPFNLTFDLDDVDDVRVFLVGMNELMFHVHDERPIPVDAPIGAMADYEEIRDRMGEQAVGGDDV